jgi:hypothetical protein
LDKNSPTEMIIKVKTFTGVLVEFELEETANIGFLIEILERKVGYSLAQFRLIFKGKPLYEESTVSESGIRSGEMIHMILKHSRG